MDMITPENIKMFLGIVLTFAVWAFVFWAIAQEIRLFFRFLRMLLDLNFHLGDLFSRDQRCPHCRRFKGELQHSDLIPGTENEIPLGMSVNASTRTVADHWVFYKCKNCGHAWKKKETY